MSLFSFKSTKKEEILFFDLKSKSLSVSVVLFSLEERPEIIFYEKIDFGDVLKLGVKKYITAMSDAFDKLSFSVRKNYLTPSGLFRKRYEMDKIHISISSPWILSQSNFFEIKKDKAFFITDNILKEIKNSERSEIIDLSLPKNKKTREGFVVFEESVIQTKLNGYKVENIFKKSVNSFEGNVFLSIIQKDILNKIVSAIGKNILVKEYFYHSFILSAFSYVRDAFVSTNDFVFLDIGGETTEVCVAEDDAIENVFSFPFGKNTIVKKVADSLMVPEELSLSLINMRCHGNCDEKTSEKVSKAIDFAVKEWSKNLFDIFYEISPKGNIPKDIFITTDDEISRIIGKKIKNDKISGKRITDTDFKISLVEDRKLSSLFKKQEILTDDVHLKLAIILVNKIFKNNG